MHLIYVRSTMYSDFRNNYYIRQKIIIYIKHRNTHRQDWIWNSNVDAFWTKHLFLSRQIFWRYIECRYVLKMINASHANIARYEMKFIIYRVPHISFYLFITIFLQYIWNFDCTTKIDAQDFLYGRVIFHVKLLNVKCIWRISK